MIEQTGFVGIDVSKAHLDLYFHPGGHRQRVSTQGAALAALIARLADMGPLKVGLEASGGYEQSLALQLQAAGIVVYIVAPGRVHDYARAAIRHAKTDALDAEKIALYLEHTHHRLAPYQPDAARMRLGALAAHRRRLLAEKGGLLGQLDTIAEPVVRTMLQARLAGIAQDVAQLDRAMVSLLKQTPHLAAQRQRLCQVAGVGPILATTLLADLPELGKVSSKVAAALLGVAPYARQSGRTHRPGQCRGGRKHLRDIAYMGVLSAIKARDDLLYPFYCRLRAKGKPFKLAMVATIRKLITILNAIAAKDPAFAQ